MASKREEKERLRQQRLAAEASEAAAARRRLILGYLVAGLLTAAVLAGLVLVIAAGGGGPDTGGAPEEAHLQPESGVFEGLEFDGREGTPPPEIQFGDLEQSARKAGCELRLDLPNEGNGHFSDENQGQYDTKPPNSGDHYGTATAAGQTADGAYRSTPPLSRVVHSLEHGRIEIEYQPDLPKEEQLALKGVFDEDPAGILMFPNPDMPYQVAVAAWQNIVGCREYNPLVLDVIRNFRDTFRGNGPEAVPIEL
jgi:hypothetical protein